MAFSFTFSNVEIPMSKAHLFKNLAKKEQREDKEAEVSYVRAEKAADEAIARKLQEAYGGNSLVREDGSRRHAWRCRECGFANFESRIACANCLAVSPRVGKDGQSIAEAKSIAGKPSTREAGLTLQTVGSRVYRTYSAPAVAMRRAIDGPSKASSSQQQLPSASQRAANNDDAGDDGEEDNAQHGSSGLGIDEDGSARVGFDEERKLFVLRMDCPRRYHRFVVGSQAKTLKDIERTCQVKLIVPRSSNDAADQGRGTTSSSMANDDPNADLTAGNDDGQPDPDKDFVLFEASSLAAVRTAQSRVETIIEEAKGKVEYTHFLSIPLGPIPSAKAIFTHLVDDMKQALVSEAANIDASVFQRPVRVHVTLLMLRLYSREEIDLAKLVLESLEPELQHIFGPNDRIALRGLATMTADVKAAHVVYMDVQRDDIYKRLLALVNRINNAFIDAGIAKPADVQNNGRLHATIMNSKWRRHQQQAHQPFNATDALRIFGDRSFGSHQLRSIEINVLGGGAAPDGYFSSIASIGFP